MKRFFTCAVMCCLLSSCSEKQDNAKLDKLSVETNNTNTENPSNTDRDTKQSTTEGNDTVLKSKNRDTKVRFIPPPTVVSDPVDPSYGLGESYGDPGDYPIGTVEQVELQESPQEEILQYAEEMPEYPGGTQALMEYLKTKITYPAQAKDEGIQGTVYIGFVVYKDGTLGSFKIRRGVRADLDKEAMRVIKAMPNWKPGKQNGKVVNCEMTLPVKFRLAE